MKFPPETKPRASKGRLRLITINPNINKNSSSPQVEEVCSRRPLKWAKRPWRAVCARRAFEGLIDSRPRIKSEGGMEKERPFLNGFWDDCDRSFLRPPSIPPSE